MRFPAYLTAAAMLGLAACSDSADAPTEVTPEFATLTVDASNGFAYVDLHGDMATVVAVSDPQQASHWDIGFSATTVVLNGGSNGPGGVAGYCICQNANASGDQVMAFSETSEMLDFEGVAAGHAPRNVGAWQASVFDTSKWYRYNLTGSDHQVWPTFDVYLVKSGPDIYKLQLTNYYGPGGEPRRISFRYARLTQ